ncbi:MAG: ribosome maturation factor RimM [Pseudomonadales bacterium]|jgi:16S rRNA processing protein RimM|nr:ribosome maturation factor RimM [Pseudomonadales bacterium]MDP6471656.1 ribosome maturation factor RimM [Pseudomonadales bacterium]MDP6973058.1 ribosome maturation factor RimM [Pseudomonadales bacterium]|tara:strand:- start:200 stop:730 length:531 start_codon:yes stop_codon:yes gene_type:complete
MNAEHPDVVISGHFGGAYGVRGWVRVMSYTDPARQLLDYRPWLAEFDGSWREVEVREARTHQKGLVAWIEGVDDRNAAERLKGILIGVAAGSLPATGADEYYWRDLMGLKVRNQDGERLGRVHHMIATGANDVMAIRRAGGEETLIPFVAQFVLSVSLDEGVIEVDWETERVPGDD